MGGGAQTLKKKSGGAWASTHNQALSLLKGGGEPLSLQK